MWTFIRSRAKAFAAALAPAVAIAVIKAAEATFGFDVPADQELAVTAWITALVGGVIVERTSNG